MKKQPLVSIILPTYNREKYIKRAIKSVLNQTYKNTELILIDDGSTDQTSKIISELDKKNFKIVVLKNEINSGITKCLNKGIEMAQGKYIARIDDDDFWCDIKKLEKQINFLEKHSNYVLVGGGAIWINEEGEEVARYLMPENDKEIRKSILLENPFIHPSVVFKKNAWKLAGGYDKKAHFFEDWDLWLRFGKLGKFYNFSEYFIYYSQPEKNKSNYNIRQNLEFNVKLRKKYRNDYPGFYKSYLLGWIYYFYSFLPAKKLFYPLFSKIKKIIIHKYL